MRVRLEDVDELENYLQQRQLEGSYPLSYNKNGEFFEKNG